MLPRRIAKEPKKEKRWRSPAHLKWIRGFHCFCCGSDVNIEAAHVRIGSGAGMGQKPDDWRAVPLCAYCHRLGDKSQHQIGERSFWDGVDIESVLTEFMSNSPKRTDIRKARKDRYGQET